MFEKKHIDTLIQWAGKPCKKDNPDQSEAYKTLTEAYDQAKKWADKVKMRLEKLPNFSQTTIVFRNQPTDQGSHEKGVGGKVKPYIWIKLYPKSPEKNPEIKPFTYNFGFSINARETNKNPGFYVNLGFIEQAIEFERIQKIPALKNKYDEYVQKRDQFRISAGLSVEDGLEKSIDEMAEWVASKILNFEITYESFVKEFLELSPPQSLSSLKTINQKQGHEMNIYPLNQILYGPPGTGKTFNTINLALSIADPAFASNDRDEVKKRFDKLVEEGQIVFTTFHQSMSYEDFIEGIKPETNENGVVTYEVKSGIFKEICNSANTPNKQGFEAAYKKLQEKLRDEISGFTEDKTLQLSTPRGKEFSVSLNSKGNLRLYTGKDKTNPQGVLTKENLQKQINGEDIWYGGYCKGVLRYLKENFGYSAENIDSDKNYVLIIDEINRGNVSQIFGELITLIEDGKRLGQEEALSVKLPYSKESERDFGVPSNLYIIGTMNTADRSVEALDAALRRRFSFIEMPPKPALIKTEGKLKDTDGILHIGELGKIDLANLLDVINKRIEKLLDSDHQIGHSFFLKVYDIESLKNEFQNKIIPLLKEYFYGDLGKLGLVLGEGFFENIETSDTSIFANFGSFDNNDFNERVIYKLKTISSNNGISGMSNEDFLDAINKLLNIKLP